MVVITILPYMSSKAMLQLAEVNTRHHIQLVRDCKLDKVDSTKAQLRGQA